MSKLKKLLIRLLQNNICTKYRSLYNFNKKTIPQNPISLEEIKSIFNSLLNTDNKQIKFSSRSNNIVTTLVKPEAAQDFAISRFPLERILFARGVESTASDPIR